MIQQAKIPAVAYYRMSSDKQDTSINDQRSEVIAMEKRGGYEILREYMDEGISGDDTDKRVYFRRMIADAKSRGDFRVILCWDQDRFGRFDSIDAGEWIAPLRRADVRLVTVAQGEIDWNDFAGRLIYNVQQEAKHQFLRDLSRNVTRGKRQKADSGNIPICKPSYGYDKVYVDETGREILRIRRREWGYHHKQPGWTAKLVVADDPINVETGKGIFRSFLELDVSVRAICRDLNDRNIASPEGGRWASGSTWRQSGC